MKKIDIALALYNGEKFLATQLDSIANQTYQSFIIHICDDGSHDSTIDLCKNHELYKVGKLIIHEISRVGSAHKNFVRVLKYCNNDYIAFCDQDDYWMPDKLEQLLKLMAEKEKSCSVGKPILVFSDLEVVDSKLEVIYPSFYATSVKSSECKSPFDFILSNHIPGCVMLFNKALKDKSLPIPEDFRMHDWWICFVASYYGEIFFCKKPLIKYRQHGENTVGVVGIKSNKKLFGFFYFFQCLFEKSKKTKENYFIKVSNDTNINQILFNKFLREELSFIEKIKIFKIMKIGEGKFVAALVWFLL